MKTDEKNAGSAVQSEPGIRFDVIRGIIDVACSRQTAALYGQLDAACANNAAKGEWGQKEST